MEDGALLELDLDPVLEDANEVWAKHDLGHSLKGKGRWQINTLVVDDEVGVQRVHGCEQKLDDSKHKYAREQNPNVNLQYVAAFLPLLIERLSQGYGPDNASSTQQQVDDREKNDEVLSFEPICHVDNLNNQSDFCQHKPELVRHDVFEISDVVLVKP